MEKSSNTKVHFGYIIFMLIAIIILLISVKWGNIEKLVDYLTFALTLTSLVLAILAIIYTVFSNTKFIQNISKLDNISTDVEKASQALRDSTKDLEVKIECIPTALKNMEDKADEIHKLTLEMNSKSTEPQQEEVSVETVIDTFEGVVKNSLKITSFSGMTLLYACFLAKKHSKSFSLNELFEDNKEFIFGCLTSIHSLNIVKMTHKERIVTILYLNDIIEKNIFQNIKQLAIEFDKEKEYSDKDDLSWVKLTNNITKYFDDTNIIENTVGDN